MTAEQERAAVVAFLQVKQFEAEMRFSFDLGIALEEAAQAIEAGEHLLPPPE